MKKLGFIGMAVMAMLVSANLSSCSKEDGNSSGFVNKYANEKKITKIVSESVTYAQTSRTTTTFKYDSNGRLIETIDEYKGPNNQEESRGIAQYTWTNTAVIYTEEYEIKSTHHGNFTETYKFKYGLSNGLVRSVDYGDGDSENLSYNEDGRYDNEGTWEWNGDKLICVLGDYKVLYTYGEPCKSGYYYPIADIDASALFLAHPELLGVRTKQLPVSCKGSGYYAQDVSPYTSTYEYEFDTEGYIIKTIVTRKFDNGSIHTFTDTITWE
ncbi:MAG: hypothetical protein J6J57_05430 [Alistipes sp.]|nr:hypothetical protein [Alistipes sp.]